MQNQHWIKCRKYRLKVSVSTKPSIEFFGNIEYRTSTSSFHLTPSICISFPGVARVLSELPQEQIEEGLKQMCVQQVQLLAQVNYFGWFDTADGRRKISEKTQNNVLLP